jgi:hypothetical protein
VEAQHLLAQAVTPRASPGPHSAYAYGPKAHRHHRPSRGKKHVTKKARVGRKMEKDGRREGISVPRSPSGRGGERNRLLEPCRGMPGRRTASRLPHQTVQRQPTSARRPAWCCTKNVAVNGTSAQARRLQKRVLGCMNGRKMCKNGLDRTRDYSGFFLARRVPAVVDVEERGEYPDAGIRL